MNGGLGGLDGAIEITHLVSRQAVVDIGGKGSTIINPIFASIGLILWEKDKRIC